jgi:hypothetical protein
MSKPIHIVFTTIYHPAVLENLHENVAGFNHLDSVKVWVVGDRKTPSSCGELARAVSERGLETHYLDVSRQDQWGTRCKEFYDRLPYNNETRRNIGYLHALEDGCEILISIDDDNFPTDEDLVGFHTKTGTRWAGDVIEEESGFHNVCEYLEVNPNRRIFPRGFPFRLRGLPNSNRRLAPQRNVTIGVSAGLWLSDPDVDATTWLNGKVSAMRYLGEDTQVLSRSTWAPVNTQNTSVVRELIPAYLCVPMGWNVPGGTIQRYGDIWGGYFLQALMKGTGYHIAFGRPIVDHRRNPHEYVDDLRYEYWGMILTDWLVERLKNDFYPRASAIADRVVELAGFLKTEAIPALPDWCPREINEFLSWTEGNLRAWSAACRSLSGD